MNLLASSCDSAGCAIGGLGFFFLIIGVIAVTIDVFVIIKAYTLAKLAGRNTVVWVVLTILSSVVALAILCALVIEDLDDSSAVKIAQIPGLKKELSEQKKEVEKLKDEIGKLRTDYYESKQQGK